MYSLLLLAVILAVVYIFYKFVISPMRDHFQQEKIDLRSKHTQLMAAFAEMDPDPIFRFDEDGKVVMANQAGNELLKNDFVIGKKLENFIPEIKQVDIKGCIREGLQLDVGAPIGDKYFRFTLTGLPGMGIGQIYGSDITELKETENKLIDAAKKAEDSEKIKSYFLAQMSHEIRSPLTAVLGFNAIIKEELQGQGSITEDLSYAFNAVEVSGIIWPSFRQILTK
jgi:signal transduction histidine kinase